MSIYGVQPTGYVRKPLTVILAELEAKMITQFGPGVIQTAQSPFGQLNGLMADLLAEVDEHNLDLYQSYDPDQAEGVRLATLARIRLVDRGSMTDEQFRKTITNSGQGRIDIQDLAHAIRGIEGVTYVRVFLNDTGEVDVPELERGVVAVAVIGGDDTLVAETIRRYVVPGVSTYGNAVITTNLDGFCRSMSVIRPVEVTVNVSVQVSLRRDSNNCPAPSTAAIAMTLSNLWLERRENGLDVNAFTVRSIIESTYSNVEVVGFTGARDGVEGAINQTVAIAFTEIANLVVDGVYTE